MCNSVCFFRSTWLYAAFSFCGGEDALEPTPSDTKELLYFLYSYILDFKTEWLVSKSFFNYLYAFYLHWCLACMYVCVKMSDTMEPELQTVGPGT